MTTTINRTPVRRLDRERTTTALRAAQAILLDGAPLARVALAYAMSPEAMGTLLADLNADLQAAVEVKT